MSDENSYDEEVSCLVAADNEDDGLEVETVERSTDTPAPSEAASEVIVVASDDEEDDEVLATVLVEEGDASSPSNKRSRKKPGPKPKRKRTSDDCEDAAEEARAMLQHIVTRLPMNIGDDGTLVRALGRVVTNDERFSSSHHIYPVGFSCDRYEFSPVHGRIVKFRCTILDGKDVQKKQEENGLEVTVSNGPLFRIMWGAGIDEEQNTVDYRYQMNLVSSAVTNGKPEENSEELIPDEGMRVRVKYERDQWYSGTITEVEEQKNGESEITIQYDDGSLEHAIYPDPDIVLYVPGCEDVAIEDGVVEPSEINGKSVTTVIGASAIEAWGKAMVAMGLIDGITLEKGLEAVSCARNPVNVEKNEEKEETDMDVDAEEQTAEEQELREKIDALKEDLESAREKDRETSIALADSRLSCLGPFLCNPFQDKESHYPQQVSWLTTAIRKEKAKMGSTGNKRKIVTATDLLRRNDTFFNADIESLVEGLPGTESLSNYLFHNFRFGFMQSSISESWRQEAHQWRKAREQEQKKKKGSTNSRPSKPVVSKPTIDPEREAKRQKREDERDARKRQKEEEMEQKKKARIEERLARLSMQVDERLFKEACFQREKVVLAVAKSFIRECYRRRKAAELVSMQSVVDDRINRIRPYSHAPLPPLSPLCQQYDEDVLRCWDFVTSYGETLIQWGYIDTLPTLDSLQQALNGVGQQSDNTDGKKCNKTVMNRTDSVDYLTKLCIALCRPLAVSLTRLLFASLIALNPALQKDFGAAFFAEIRTNTNKDDGDGLSSSDLLPVNGLTWQEIARLAFLSDALGELGNVKHEVAHFLRGYRSMGHPNSKEAKRLRRTEDFPIAVLKQVIDQATKEEERENGMVQTSVRVLTPCKPSAGPENWEFYIHNIRGLSSKKIKLIRNNIKNAMKIFQVSQNNDSDENGIMAELEKAEVFFGKMLQEKSPSHSDCTKARIELLKLLDKVTGETYTSDAVEEPVFRDLLSLEQNPNEKGTKSSKWPTRYRMDLPFVMSMNEKKYKEYVHQREEYMGDALKLKEDMEKGGEDDDDDDDDDDENEAETSDKAATSQNEERKEGDTSASQSAEVVKKAENNSDKHAAEVVATVVENADDAAKVEMPTKIGKVTPYDDFCADIPTAPDLIRRCLAVLRTVSQTNAAEPFIYPVDPQTNPGYYETILQPMCMREVGARLISAAKSISNMVDEDTISDYIDRIATEFGRNIRLIAQNCSCYPNAGATVIAAGEELLRIFERLLLDWVLAPRSLLPSLDNLDDDKCVEFHESDEDSLVLLCDGCEGKYNMGRLVPPLREVPKGDWFCPRCLNGRCWNSLDPRIEKRVELHMGNKENEIWTVECSHFIYHENGSIKPTLVYDLRNRSESTKTLTLEELDKALSDQGITVDPVFCVEAIAESPGYSLGANQGLHENLVPVPSNPLISDSAAQAFFSSSVFQDTIISSSTFMLINPENQSISEWSRLLSLLVMKCASSEMMGSLASDMEGETAEKMKNIRNENARLDIQDILPLTNGEDVDEIPKQAALPVKEENADKDKVNSDSMAVVVDANAIEVVKDVNVDAKELSPAPAAVQSNGNLMELDSAVSVEAKLKQERIAALEEREKRQKIREESIIAFCVRNQLRPTFASFDEDNISLVVDNTLGSKEKGLNLASTRCRGQSCDLCGLSDIALGSPFVRVPNAKEWHDLMPHFARNREVFLLANMTADSPEKDDISTKSKKDKLVAVTIKVGGELFSCSSDKRLSEDITDGGMLEYLLRNEEGYQHELHLREEANIPFVTGSWSAHECCAVSAHNARKDQLVDEQRERRRQLLEQDSGMLCGRTLSMGRDHCGRSYWKFKADKALFVCPSDESKSWLRYADPEVIASIIFGLGKEPVASELKHTFPEAAGLLRGRKWASMLLKRQYESGDGDKVEKPIKNADDVADEEEPYQVGEEVLVESKCGRMLWDASVIAVSHKSPNTDKITGYRVRYKSWSSRFDEWVTPYRVVEPVDNNISIQQEMIKDIKKGKLSLPKQLRGMNARRHVNSPDRARGNARVPDFMDIAGISPLSSSIEIALGAGRAGLLLIEAALPEAAVETEWSPAYSEAWRNVVKTATGPSTLMACAFLLEEHLDPEWLDPHMNHLLSCLPQRWKAIREATASSLCLRIFMLDQSIHYNANEHLNRVANKNAAVSSSNGI
mmetsp:Transcript_810/g.1246  ORF Transcript_810/g.1246 Transcript_810/m.1246 type:complete len:2185 (+) Transcript_810:285-6839(+)|eukprot:CAMPEP_0194207850 /NCGR_PEP_ID=MMETSP0156-20130528/6480_1 /TAXON_ID=33649 /ORGANISM="Thalassionema nitzschioides, Strain L26-B" /LENGTH=2184 /DNA_ID=CAMNT_0038934711 /DNA_START=218 /DNA_END=6772 /DNA_ORIENTATION=-